jgi:hypothetical protein
MRPRETVHGHMGHLACLETWNVVTIQYRAREGIRSIDSPSVQMINLDLLCLICDCSCLSAGMGGEDGKWTSDNGKQRMMLHEGHCTVHPQGDRKTSSTKPSSSSIVLLHRPPILNP